MRLIILEPVLPRVLEVRILSAVEAALASHGLTLQDCWRALRLSRPAATATRAIRAAEAAAAQLLDADPVHCTVPLRIGLVGNPVAKAPSGARSAGSGGRRKVVPRRDVKPSIEQPRAD